VDVVIAFYSRTGNTQAMADLLGDEARLRGHSVRLVHITHDRKPGFFGCLSLASGKRVADIANPESDLDLGSADMVILGAPVWGGRFAPFVRTYLERAKGRDGKPVGVFVSCSYPLQRAERFAPEMGEYVASMGLTVKGTMCASRKDRPMHREIGRAFLDGLLGPDPAAAPPKPPPPPPMVEGEAPAEAPKGE